MFVHQAGQHQGLAFKGRNALVDILLAEALLAHLSDGQEPLAKLRILCLVDRAKAALPALFEDSIALPQHFPWLKLFCCLSCPDRCFVQLVKRFAAGKAELCLHWIGRATIWTKDR